jgi:mono/diheme cytochrome c family protein
MRIELFVDDELEPRAALDAPAQFELDTTDLLDGPHVLHIRAREEGEPAGVQNIPFTVGNGPGIAVFGLADDEVVRGRVPLLVNAYGSRVGDTFDPVRAETPAPVPTWTWVLALGIAAFCLWYLASAYREYAAELASNAPSASSAAAIAAPQASGTAPAQPGGVDSALGAQVFGNYCAPCHQQTGTGLPSVFPPLAGDPVVNAADPTEHIHTVLHGLQNKTIGGVAYAAAMPPFAAQLSDEQIVAVVNHERTSFGNSAPTTKLPAVSALREQP